MQRRKLIGLAASGAGLGLLSLSPSSASPARTPKNAGTTEFVNSSGAKLFIRRWGAGAPVLFLAGWTLPSDFWSYQMVAFAQRGFQAISYDRRGHGRSSDPGSGFDHDTLADDLAAIIDSLKLDRVTLVGHSMAGMEIARYFSRHGGRKVDRIALVGTITPFLMKTAEHPRGLDRATLAALREPLLRDFPGWIEANAKPFFTAETSQDMITWGKSLMLQTSLMAAVELARRNAETDFREDLKRINVPTLVVHGDRDASAPAALTAVPTAELVRNSRLVMVEGAPHGLPLTHIERLNHELLAFAHSEATR